MKLLNLPGNKFKVFLIVFSLCLLFSGLSISAQSSNQSFPTPITSNEISGTIKARDIGDARLTTYFYTFTGNQGDVFINIVTSNFDGDIDLFTADTLKPLTKIVVFSDNSDNETGRVVYLRQSQKLLLRIEGRPPNDEPATFRIKFAGSFQPASGISESEEPKLPELNKNPQSGVKVNAVGTIIEVKPKPTPKTIEKVAAKKEEKNAEKSVEKLPENVDLTIKTEENPEKDVSEKKAIVTPEVIISENLPKPEETKTAENSQTKPKPIVKAKTPKSVKTKPGEKTVEKPAEPNPLESIQLIVLFKDGTRFERLMSEVLKVSVDKGILTIISKDGSIGRYSILDVAKMTIE